jgi:riboflavin kinase/FMN adenylyltransferase
VVAGDGRGRTLGFPTANVKTESLLLVPDEIYATRTRCCGRWHKSVTYIGTKPTFSKARALRSTEVYIFGFKKNIYGQSLEIEFIKKIRPDKKFPDVASLVAQMEKDAHSAKIILKSFS